MVNQTKIKQLLKSQYPCKSSETSTHNFFNGLKLKVPRSELNNFYCKLTDLYGDIFPAIAESVNAYDDYKFFVDCDDETADINNIINDIEKVFSNLFDNEIKNCILKRGDKNKYHIIFDILVNREMTNHILKLLNPETLDKIDKSVYKTGLRISNSLKDKNDKFSHYSTNFNSTHSILINSETDPTKISKEYQDFLNNEQLENEKIKSDNIQTEQQEQIKNIKNNMLFNIKKLADCLSIQRLTNYNEGWCDVMFCLKNIGFSSKINTLDILLKISQKVPSKYNKTDIIKQWTSLKYNKNGLNIGSLHHWAREDNEIEYLKIVKSQIDIKDFSTFTIAETIYNLKKNSYVFVMESDKEQRWKLFKGGVWKTDPKGTSLLKYISTGLYDIYNNKIKKLIKKYETDEENDNKKIIATLLSNLNKLRDVKFKYNVLIELEQFFIDVEFLKKADTIATLIGFNNGVYDLDKKIFRKQEYNDRVLMSTNYEFEPERNKTMNKIIMKYFNEIMPVEENRDYLLTHLATCLEGFNQNELYPNWIGRGRNGKGSTVRLMKYTLGDYVGELPVSILTQKRVGSDGPSSCLHSLMKKRFVISSEPDNGSKLNDAIVKNFTGGDEIQTRELYCKSSFAVPQFTLFLQCNKLPDVKDNSEGLWSRFKLLKFSESFTGKKANTKLKTEMEKWKNEFFHILLEYYNKWINNNRVITVPDAFLKLEQVFKNSQNVIKDFCDNNLEKTENNNIFVCAKELYLYYKEWLEQEGIVEKKKKKEFLEEIEQFLNIDILERKNINGVYHRSIILNYRLTNEDDNDDYDIDESNDPLDAIF